MGIIFNRNIFHVAMFFIAAMKLSAIKWQLSYLEALFKR